MDSLVPFSQMSAASAGARESRIPGVTVDAAHERWHGLLTTRYVCEICLTRYFVMHDLCPACHRFGQIRPLVSMLMSIARDDEDLRTMIAQGQTVFGEASSEGQDATQSQDPGI